MPSKTFVLLSFPHPLHLKLTSDTFSGHYILLSSPSATPTPSSRWTPSRPTDQSPHSSSSSLSFHEDRDSIPQIRDQFNRLGCFPGLSSSHVIFLPGSCALTKLHHTQAKAILLHKIDAFIRDRIILADKVIEQHAIPKIKDRETILTYARSSVVEGVLLEAKRQGKSFSVVVVDSRPLYEGSFVLSTIWFYGRTST